VHEVMSLRAPKNAGKISSVCTIDCLSSCAQLQIVSYAKKGIMTSANTVNYEGLFTHYFQHVSQSSHQLPLVRHLNHKQRICESAII
jgi:hypothetical protein